MVVRDRVLRRQNLLHLARARIQESDVSAVVRDMRAFGQGSIKKKKPKSAQERNASHLRTRTSQNRGKWGVDNLRILGAPESPIQRPPHHKHVPDAEMELVDKLIMLEPFAGLRHELLHRVGAVDWQRDAAVLRSVGVAVLPEREGGHDRFVGVGEVAGPEGEVIGDDFVVGEGGSVGPGAGAVGPGAAGWDGRGLRRGGKDVGGEEGEGCNGEGGMHGPFF